MKALNLLLAPFCVVSLWVAAGAASASDINKPTHLTNSGNTAVNNVKAKQYLQGGQQESGGQPDADGNIYDPSSDTLVHMGSAKKGNCNMNVGGVKSGNETVVTAKNIVNVCK